MYKEFEIELIFNNCTSQVQLIEAKEMLEELGEKITDSLYVLYDANMMLLSIQNKIQ